jgi:hypothetical protein
MYVHELVVVSLLTTCYIQVISDLLQQLVATTCCESFGLINLVPDLLITGKKQCEQIFLTNCEIITCLGRILSPTTVLENVRQRQQHRCQEIFDKISSQEIFLHLAGNSCHLIYIISCTQCAWIITIHIIMVYVLKCHIIYLLFKKSKSILLVEIVLC